MLFRQILIFFISLTALLNANYSIRQGNSSSKISFTKKTCSSTASGFLKNGSIIENINLIFNPQINATVGSGFELNFENGGFTKYASIVLCSNSTKVGNMYSMGISTIKNTMSTPKFQFMQDINEFLISQGNNITFHKDSCSGENPTIKVNGNRYSKLKVKIDKGINSQGMSISDYNTNSVQIAKVR